MAFSPFKFLQEVRSETAKVTWPTRRDDHHDHRVLAVEVALASVFFFASVWDSSAISSPCYWASTDDKRRHSDDR